MSSARSFFLRSFSRNSLVNAGSSSSSAFASRFCGWFMGIT